MLNSLKYRIRKEVKEQTGILPDYLIIGAMKCGTTSLYNYLTQHPNVLPAAKKEIHFFDWEFQKGLPCYRFHFPTRPYRFFMRAFHKFDFISGEASPYYMFHPHVAKRVSQIIPQVKLIAILRNPVDRAYSHYWHWIRENIEALSFEDAIKAEPERLQGEVEKMLEDETYDSYNYGYYSYLARGRYYEQIKRWNTFFPKEQILVLSSEELYGNPPKTMNQVASFLGLPKWRLKEHKSHNAGKYPKMPPETKEMLTNYFAPHNEKLYNYVGRDFGWDR